MLQTHHYKTELSDCLITAESGERCETFCMRCFLGTAANILSFAALGLELHLPENDELLEFQAQPLMEFGGCVPALKKYEKLLK